MQRVALLALFLGLGVLGAQALRVETSPGPNPWNHLNVPDDPGRFHFAIVSDRTGGNRQEVFGDTVYKLNLLQPAFVMSVGDLQEGYTSNPKFITSFWNTFTRLAGALEMPFFYVPGNHDLNSTPLREEWKRRFGRNYYHFLYKDVLFLCLDSQDPSGAGIGPEQRAWVRQVLAENRTVRWTFFFFHQPLWTSDRDTGWGEIESLLEDRPYTVFTGHQHKYFKAEHRGREHYILATTGGHSRLRGPVYGEFDHLVWVSLLPEGPPRIANLMLDGVWDRNVRTPSSDAQFSGFLNDSAVRLEPIVSAAPSFSSGTTRLVLRNDADYPMSFTAFFEPHESLRAAPDRLRLVLPPKSERPLDVKVSSERPVRPEDLPPQWLHWTAHYNLPSQTPIDLEGRAPLLIDRAAYDCPRRTSPVALDGRLDEWPTLPFAVREPLPEFGAPGNQWNGPADLSFRFATAYDDDNVYVAIDVRDDALVFDPLVKHWEQDGVEVWLDPNPGPAGRRSGDVLYLGISAGDSPANLYIDDRAVVPPGVRVASVKTATGHTTEIAIPHTYLNEKQGGAWKQFRLNIGALDRDPNRWTLRLRWRPEWGTGEFPASGLFRRQ